MAIPTEIYANVISDHLDKAGIIGNLPAENWKGEAVEEEVMGEIREVHALEHKLKLEKIKHDAILDLEITRVWYKLGRVSIMAVTVLGTLGAVYLSILTLRAIWNLL